MTSIVIGKDRINLLESERYIAGTKQVYKLKTSFSDDWRGLDKKLIFKTDCFELAVDVNGQSETIPMPWELFAEPSNKFQIGAYGCRCDEKILNTRLLSLGRIWKGTVDASCNCGCGPNIPSKPSPVTYQELKALIERKADRLTFEDGQFILWSGIDPLSAFEAPVALPDGGVAGQVLAKASDRDGDYVWKTIETTTGPTVALNLPIGSIIAWSGSVNSIPEGYSLCDGQNGTRDLRDSFILGAGLNLEPGDSAQVDFLAPESTRIKVRSLQHEVDVDPDMGIDPAKPQYYALAYIQKTSLTESDLKEGKDAYDIAVGMGFKGTIAEWLESLHGKSAYEIAKENGFVGSEVVFGQSLASIPTSLKDLVISRRSELPIEITGAYCLENVEFQLGLQVRSRTSISSARVNKDFVYIDLRDPNRIVLTSLSNDRVICDLDKNGVITRITSETLRSQLENVVGEGGTGVGTPGASAYEIAVANGFSGTEEQWLASLKGSTGLSAYQVAKANGFDGTEAEWVESLKGANGKSAYELAVQQGFEGTLEEWLESLKGSGTGNGEKGDPGLSAYEIAQENGFEGTEAEWLESLKGAKGDKGDSVKMLTDYLASETLVGRWEDGRPLYARVITTTLYAADGEALIAVLTNIDFVSASGTIKLQNGSKVCAIPGFDGAVTYGVIYNENTGELKLVSTLPEYSDAEAQIVVYYTKDGDSAMSDDELILNPIVSGEGTADHTKLINRDAVDQHPIKAITTLTSQLAERPNKRISEEQIKEMFDNA